MGSTGGIKSEIVSGFASPSVLVPGASRSPPISALLRERHPLKKDLDGYPLLTTAFDERTEAGTSPAPGPSVPELGLLAIALSIFGIAAAAIVVCCLAAVIVLLVIVAQTGVEGAAEWMQRLRFDVPLKTRIGAGIVSSLYLGVLTATLIAARIAGRGAWASLLAFVRPRRLPPSAIVLAGMTLAYAATATFAMSRMQERHIVISGPTDLLLIGTILTNLGLLAPLAEELFFRGWIYTALRQRFSFAPSFTLVAASFAAIHWDANHRRIFLVLPLAVALGLLREITGSVKPTIALHSVYNLIIVAITLAAS